MKKRGQITLFIILGIFLVTIIVLTVYFRTSLLKEGETELQKQLAMPAEIREVRNQIQNCLEIVSEEGLIFLGLQGGYINTLMQSVYMDNFAIGYGYVDNEITLPSMEEIQLELGDYINQEIVECFTPEDYPSLEIKEYVPNTLVEFTENKVILSTEYRLDVSKDTDTYIIETPYNVDYDVRFKKIYQVSEKILQQIVTNPDTADIQSLLELGMDINVYQVYDDVVYEVIDDLSNVNGEEFYFMFAQG